MIRAPTDDAIDAAAERLARGDLVGLPTETVYGLAADAANAEAVALVFARKGRPAFNPLIVHAGPDADPNEVAHLSEAGRALLHAFAPGPITLVLPHRGRLPDAVTGGLPTLALRVPAHPVAQSLLRAHGGFLVAPSANPSGGVSPTTAAHVAESFPELLVLDGGPCAFGVESTIVGLAGEAPTLLRPGALPAEAIEAVLGRALAAPGHGVQAPGMTTSHYAPRARLRLNADAARPGEALLGFGGTPGAVLDLSSSGDLAEAAANLFAMLRRLDADHDAIAVAPVPSRGLGAAINDRLRRAAAPRG